MASERQILANRRNAQQSTGPATALGRKRSSKNAYSHGLSLPVCKVEWRKELEELTRLFAADASNPDILELAERAAEAQVDLTRVGHVKARMLKRASIKAQEACHARPELSDLSGPLREGEEQQFVDAVRHILPELIKINRYEKRAASRRDRALNELASMKKAGKR